jgi:hypothetical protein
MNSNFGEVTGSGEGADPDVVASHFHVVNLFSVVDELGMDDKSAGLCAN